MKNQETNFKGQEVRNSTTSEYAIFFEGKELKTTKSGALNSSNGIVLTAQLPSGEWIKWRHNDNLGVKGFSFDKPYMRVEEDKIKNQMPQDLKQKLEYKI
jgi:hypothetical protein